MSEDYEKLVKRAVQGLKRIGRFRYEDCDEPHSLDCTLAGRVMRVFGIGMTRACQLCELAGEDPHFDEAEERYKERVAKAMAEMEERGA